ncbi:MAG: type II toxin-antitoxin system death-on-curing family toxin [Chloroflexi bacterium]|nr:type II toxin-antitoxin system death-on-curing family toxin [Chloroflexota bacterium]
MPQQTFGGVYLHRTVFDKAAALFRSVVKNHALLDGNKRLGLTTVAVFLWVNGYVFFPSSADAVTFTLRIASTGADSPNLKEIARWLQRQAISNGAIHRKLGQVSAWLDRTSAAHDRLDAELNSLERAYAESLQSEQIVDTAPSLSLWEARMGAVTREQNALAREQDEIDLIFERIRQWRNIVESITQRLPSLTEIIRKRGEVPPP